MAEQVGIQVFFEPKIERHDKRLYEHVGLAEGVSAHAILEGDAKAQFVRDGFLLVKSLLSRAELVNGIRELNALTRSDTPKCEMIWFEGGVREHWTLADEDDRDMDGKRADSGFTLGQSATQLPALDPEFRANFVRKVMGFVDQNPGLAALAHHPRIMQLVSDLIGARPKLFQEMALIKPPGGREKPWHQDHAYFNLPLDTPVLGIWLPFGEATPANGCMHVVAGGHKDGPRVHFKRRDWQICDTDVALNRRLAVPMDAGDVLFFDGKLPHGTPINDTDEQRWAVQYHYCPSTAMSVDDQERLNAFGSDGKDVTC